MKETKKNIRKNLGAVLAEAGLALPILLFIIFGTIEIYRMLYIKNTMNIAAQQVAGLVGRNANSIPAFDLAQFSAYADQIRYPGSVVSSNQFSFDVLDSSNTSTVSNGFADSAVSTKVLVTVTFPPPGDSSYKVPFFDPGRLLGMAIFGENGIMLSAQAVGFLENSRRPVLN